MRISQKNAENLFFSFQRHRFACLPIISISSCLFSFKYCLLCESSSLKCSQDASICDKSSSEMQYSCFEISKIMPNHLATGRGCFFGRVARIKAFAVQRLPQILCLWRRWCDFLSDLLFACGSYSTSGLLIRFDRRDRPRNKICEHRYAKEWVLVSFFGLDSLTAYVKSWNAVRNLIKLCSFCLLFSVLHSFSQFYEVVQRLRPRAKKVSARISPIPSVRTKKLAEIPCHSQISLCRNC